MNEVWRVVIIGSQPTSMLGTKLILEEQKDLVVEGMTASEADGMRMVEDLLPNVVLLDYRLQDQTSEELLERIKQMSPSTHVIIVTDNDGLSLLQSLISRGASGLLSKQSSTFQLIHMITGLREGIASLPLEWVRQGVWPLASSSMNEGGISLSETEAFIMERIVQGITYDKIASEIQVSRRSIDNYLRKIYVKLGVSTRAQAIEKYALYTRHNRQVYA
ncbi:MULTISPECIES: response regulator transcription factor [Paenibacillus]|uniref:Response regulator n=1 Tax=Paenibacillus campinasensis TaxID=66347 RepID=A0A268EPA2_9BACL|nr:response regulator transcription factor [Paenibacillus campinasensis]MUG66115.1 response regulator [Paenibacillus campinasensis]PAD74948.1 two-component system response regulator [Paenibacillus campinasensis]